MQKKHLVKKNKLAAFTALACTTAAFYSHAEVRTVPAIELNFEVLENLKHQEDNDIGPQISNKSVKKPNTLQPDLNNAERIVTPQLKPAQQEPNEDAIIIKKADEAVELPLPTLPEEAKSHWSIFSNFLNKIIPGKNGTDNKLPY